MVRANRDYSGQRAHPRSLIKDVRLTVKQSDSKKHETLSTQTVCAHSQQAHNVEMTSY